MVCEEEAASDGLGEYGLMMGRIGITSQLVMSGRPPR